MPKERKCSCNECKYCKNRNAVNKYRSKPGIREQQTAYRKAWSNRLREEALNHYGRKCVCCGEDEKRFLTFDHINNDGSSHRKEATKEKTIYKWLKDNNFPPTFQVLCANCNLGKHWNKGVCPHKR